MPKRAVADFLARKDIVISFQRYAIDALAAMAQGLFASLLMGTIFTTVSDLTGIALFAEIGAFAKSVAGPAMAIAIGYALKTPPLVLFSLAAVGFAANEAGGAGGPLAVLVVAIVASEFGKAVSKETDIDILVTPATTILVGQQPRQWATSLCGRPSCSRCSWASSWQLSLASRSRCPFPRRPFAPPWGSRAWPGAQPWRAAARRWWASLQ